MLHMLLSESRFFFCWDRTAGNCKKKSKKGYDAHDNDDMGTLSVCSMENWGFI